MMYRGIKGTFVYVCDPKLREYFKNHIKQAESNSIVETKEEWKPRILPIEDVNPFKNSVPIYDFYAAAGEFSVVKTQEEINQFDWISVPENQNVDDNYFVCKIKGESMNRVIKNGSYCLFRRDTGGSRNGKIVLVEHYDIQDIDSGTRFTIKEYSSEKHTKQDGWRHNAIRLTPKSFDEKYKDIILKNEQLEELKVVGIFVCVIE